MKKRMLEIWADRRIKGEPLPFHDLKYRLTTFCVAVLITLYCADLSEAQTMRQESPQIDTRKDVRPTASQGWTWDMSRFLLLDNPREAAGALRAHAQAQGVSLDSRQSALGGQGTTDETRRHKVKVFNRSEFTPNPGIEAALSALVQQEASTEQKVVCLLQISQDLSVGELADLLDQDVKVESPSAF